MSYSSSSTTHSLQPINPITDQFFSDTDILDSSSTSPSAPNDPDYQQITSEKDNSSTQNVNSNTLQNQTFLDTNSDISFIETQRPPLPEIPITPNPLYHIPDPESVIPFITRSPHRPSTAIKTSRLQSNLQEQENPLSDSDSTSSSTLYPKLKLKKTSISSSLSSLINKELQKPQKATTSRYNLRSSKNIEQEEQSISSSSRQRYHLRSTRHSSRERSPILSLGSSLSFLERQQAQPRSTTSSEINLSLPSRQQSLSLLTSGFEVHPLLFQTT